MSCVMTRAELATETLNKIAERLQDDELTDIVVTFEDILIDAEEYRDEIETAKKNAIEEKEEIETKHETLLDELEMIKMEKTQTWRLDWDPYGIHGGRKCAPYSPLSGSF